MLQRGAGDVPYLLETTGQNPSCLSYCCAVVLGRLTITPWFALHKDKFLGYAGLDNEFGEYVDEIVHQLAAGDGTPQALICFAAFFLSLPLRSPCLPVKGDRFGNTVIYVFCESALIHDATISGFLPKSNTQQN